MISLLIKPESSICKIECKDCFYKSECNKDTKKCNGVMGFDLLEEIIKKSYTDAKSVCSFSFQCVEAINIEFDFFRKVIELEQKYNVNKIPTMNTIQINSISIDDDFAKFLADNKFLLWLSIDGPSDIHNENKNIYDKEAIFDKVIKTKKILDRYKVDYNVVSVITSKNADKADKLYNFYKTSDIKFVHLIPHFDKAFNSGDKDLSLKPNEYAIFLKKLFDIWYKDYKKGKQVSVRLFENICAMLLGHQAESCDLRGCCTIQNVIETNGDLYPCEFYINDERKIENIKNMSLKKILKEKRAINFIKESLVINDKCKKCKYVPLCKGGCKKYKTQEEQEYYFCDTFREFYDYTLDRFIKVCNDIKRKS